MKFEHIKNELNNEIKLTENGALGYKTSGKELLDINFKASSLRDESESNIYIQYKKAFYENKLLAIKWLFFLRDIKCGMGERRSFRVILKYLAFDYPEIVKELIPLIPEYGRWDDLWCLLDTDLKDEVVKFCYLQFLQDIKNLQNDKSISLLAKWLPSYNTSKNISNGKKKKNEYAVIFCNGFNLSKKSYNKSLKSLREYLDIVEKRMSNREWDKINYSHVPSRANLKYSNAFLRNDQQRREAYLNALSKGNVKINAGTLFVHEIVHQYSDRYSWMIRTKDYDATLEELWKALPSISEINDTIVVRDSSDSMFTTLAKTNTTALDVSTALAIYFSQFLKGEFKDKFITFSENPELVDMSNCTSLKEKLDLSYIHSEIANTDIKAVFELILNTAIKNGYPQEMLPKNILIVSDMEFDSATYTCRYTEPDEVLFNKIKKEFAKHGYNLPRIIFWNVCSRTNVVPVKENELGVTLVGGFSQNILNMVLNGSLDPYQNLIDILNTERYLDVEEAYKRAK